eukprot:gnl/Spiro4/23954_TR11862_c0_g1_i1.p1 gnl/Spiro4/23954_TR11862_c0_g1~~gnl/Spiro4/23954_TR11862_c0_g1_i1.p1  ORF type:complete len:571 (+),score=121.60 gnl/Spiro4/23954_TR11862_c0_g1_i1:203-1714(+)
MAALSSNVRRVMPGGFGGEDLDIFHCMDEERTRTEACLNSNIDWGRVASQYGLAPEQLNLLEALKTPARLSQLLAHEQEALNLAESCMTLLNRIDVLRPKEPGEWTKENEMELQNAIKNIQYLLCHIEQILLEDRRRCQIFLSVGKMGTTFNILVRHLSVDDDLILIKAAFIFAMLIRWDCSRDLPKMGNHTAMFLQWCSSMLKDEPKKEAMTDMVITKVLECLMELLQIDINRIHFCASERNLRMLYDILNAKSDYVQQVYNASFCIWLLTFNRELAKTVVDSRPKIVDKLLERLRDSPKAKLVRITLAIIKNIVQASLEAPELLPTFAEEMVNMPHGGLPRLLFTLKLRQWDDLELEESLNFLDQWCEKAVDEMCSFDAYRKEIEGRTISWSPVHTSDKFWQTSVFEIENYQSGKLIKFLCHYIQSPTPVDLELAVCLHDLGEFVRVHPRGRDILKALDPNAKNRIMLLMDHQNDRVKKEALIATQKLMVSNYDLFSRSMS